MPAVPLLIDGVPPGFYIGNFILVGEVAGELHRMSSKPHES